MPSESPSLWAAGALVLILGILSIAGRRRFNSLPKIAPVPGQSQGLPDCMVVIPARNEEATIGRAVRSLPHDTVIVVDDYSTDGTAKVARGAGAGVLNAPELPRNALGKPNACAFGARALTSRWVLFTDADTWFESGFLEAAIAAADASGVALLSIHLEPECRRIAEHALVPYARALAFTGFSLTSDRRGLFRGQCLLALREPYSFMGGHSAVVSQVVEDVRLTFIAERHRLKLGIARAGKLGHIRMYQGYRGIREGIRRQAFRFMIVNPAIGVTIMLAAAVAALWLPVLLWLVMDEQWLAAWLLGITPMVILAPWYRPVWSALLAPLAFYWILPSLAGGLWAAVFGRPIVWKGRKVRAVS